MFDQLELPIKIEALPQYTTCNAKNYKSLTYISTNDMCADIMTNVMATPAKRQTVGSLTETCHQPPESGLAGRD